MALTAPRSGADRSRRDLSAPWRHLDPILLVCTLAIAGLGTLMVFRATKGSGDAADTSFLKKQLLFMVIREPGCIDILLPATVISFSVMSARNSSSATGMASSGVIRTASATVTPGAGPRAPGPRTGSWPC